MKKSCQTLLFLFIGCKSFALGLGDWKCDTPGGNVVYHDRWDSVTRLYFSTTWDQKVDSIDSWYFYKNFIVGTSDQSSRYFVVNESTGQIKLFSGKEEWLKYIKVNRLAPVLMTRWFYGDWSFEVEFWPFYAIFDLACGFIFSAILSLFWLAYKTVRKKKVKLWRVYLFTAPITTLFFWASTYADFLLSKFPQSI